MHAYYCDHFVLPLPPAHRFPMEKYRLLRQRVSRELPGIQMYVPRAASEEALTRVHTPAYVEQVLTGSLEADQVRRIGFPWSPALVERSRRSVGGTVAAARQALFDGGAVNLAGGTHHAFADRGEGFCVFNDVAVSIAAMKHEARIERAAVVDLDVHQGNGTAHLFAADPSVFTASVHGAGNFPFRKERGDLDVALPDGAGDRDFLAATRRALAAAVEHGPDLLYYIAGADAHVGDRLGRLAVSQQGLASRDLMVVDACRRHAIPLVIVMAGGYGTRVEDTVAIHFHSVEALLMERRKAA
ncbi:MAG: histone deacetylase [Gemmatimonadetes bacterium]|nr:histone deacetylase [Gemmatimonadota bacterium]